MIKKTFITFFILFISYSCFVAYIAPDWWHASQHQWQENKIKAQKFLYEENTFQNVIIGTSLSSRLIMDSLPNTYNLALGGLGIFDGLSVLEHKSKLPENIFIEINFVLKPENEDFTSSVFSTVMFYPRKYIFSLREDKQPIAVLGQIPFLLKNRYRSPEKVKEKDNPIFEELLKDEIVEFSQKPEKDDLAKAFNKLRHHIKTLENRGAHIIFFEMPVNEKLETLPFAKDVRESFYYYFSPSTYEFTQLPRTIFFHTTDGLHLKESELVVYTKYFKSQNLKYFSNRNQEKIGAYRNALN